MFGAFARGTVIAALIVSMAPTVPALECGGLILDPDPDDLVVVAGEVLPLFWHAHVCAGHDAPRISLRAADGALIAERLLEKPCEEHTDFEEGWALPLLPPRVDVAVRFRLEAAPCGEPEREVLDEISFQLVQV